MLIINSVSILTEIFQSEISGEARFRPFYLIENTIPYDFQQIMDRINYPKDNTTPYDFLYNIVIY